MKDTHNIILILVSSKWSIPSFGVCSWWINSWYLLLIFLSRSSKISQLYHHEAPSKSSQGFTLCSQLLFPFDHSFITGVLHGGSTWWFIKDLIPFWSAHRDSFQRSSSILHLAFWSEIPSTLSFQVVLCHSWQFPFVFHDSEVVKNEIFKTTYFSLELSCVKFHLKFLLRIVAIYGVYKWPKFFFYPPGEIVSCLLVHINPIYCFPLVAEFQLIILRSLP